MQVLPTEEWTKEEIKKDQISDPDLAIILQFKEQGQRPTWNEIADKTPTVKAYWTQWDSLTIEEGCLKRIWESSDGKTKHSLIVVPKVEGIWELTKHWLKYDKDFNGRVVGNQLWNGAKGVSSVRR